MSMVILKNMMSLKYAIIYIFLTCTIFIHFRGKKRLKFSRQIVDPTALMSPINCLMYLFSAVPNKPYLVVQDIPNLSILKENWQAIRDEGLTLMNKALITGNNNNDDAGFHTFFKRGWKRFYLKWYHTAHPSAVEECPITSELLKQIPEVKAGMFALLPPGGKLGLHRDPYAGSLRYHLGLSTPNSDDCAILVDGQKYSWRDGEDVLFDETFVHEAYNNTNQERLILFCDVARPMSTIIGRWLNKFFSSTIMKAASSPNTLNDRTGFINKAFKYVYAIQQIGQQYKKKHYKRYYFIKHLIYVVIILLVLYI